MMIKWYRIIVKNACIIVIWCKYTNNFNKFQNFLEKTLIYR